MANEPRRINPGELIQTNQEDGSGGDFGFADHGLGALSVVVGDSHAHPPVSGWTGEFLNLGSLVAALETAGCVGGAFLVGERADLNGPASANVEGGGSLENFEADPCGAGEVDVDGFGGGQRKIEDAAFDEGPAIGDAQLRGMAGLEIRNTHDGAERQGEVRGGHGIHVVDFAIRSAAIVIWRAVPARHAGLFEDGLGAGGEAGVAGGSGGGGLIRGRLIWGRLCELGGRRDGGLGMFFGAPRQKERAQ